MILEAERGRILKEIEQVQANVERLETRLRDESFLSKAPAVVIDKEKGTANGKSG